MEKRKKQVKTNVSSRWSHHESQMDTDKNGHFRIRGATQTLQEPPVF
jgi:hypothetical protein